MRIKKPRVWIGEINRCPPSANVLQRTHHRLRKELKDVWYVEIYAAFANDMPTRATGRRRVRVVVTSTQERDYSNIWLGVDKLIHDNLTALGWIVDDKPKFMTPVVEGAVGKPHTLIEITEAL